MTYTTTISTHLLAAGNSIRRNWYVQTYEYQTLRKFEAYTQYVNVIHYEDKMQILALDTPTSKTRMMVPRDDYHNVKDTGIGDCTAAVM